MNQLLTQTFRETVLLSHNPAHHYLHYANYKRNNFEILATFSVHGWKCLRRKCKVGLLATKQHVLSIGTNALWDLNMDTKQTQQHHVPSTLYPKTRLPLRMTRNWWVREGLDVMKETDLLPCLILNSGVDAKPSTSHITDTAPWSVSLHILVRAQRLLQPVDHTALPYKVLYFAQRVY